MVYFFHLIGFIYCYYGAGQYMGHLSHYPKCEARVIIDLVASIHLSVCMHLCLACLNCLTSDSNFLEQQITIASLGFCLCVCNQEACANNLADMVDILLSFMACFLIVLSLNDLMRCIYLELFAI